MMINKRSSKLNVTISLPLKATKVVGITYTDKTTYPAKTAHGESLPPQPRLKLKEEEIILKVNNGEAVINMPEESVVMLTVDLKP